MTLCDERVYRLLSGPVTCPKCLDLQSSEETDEVIIAVRKSPISKIKQDAFIVMYHAMLKAYPTEREKQNGE